MLHKSVVLLLLLSIVLLAHVNSLATSNCRQTIIFRALTNGYFSLSHDKECNTFWITEDIDGECQWSHLIQISIIQQEICTVESDLYKFGEWEWLTESLKHLSQETPQELSDNSSAWSCSTASFYVKPPLPDSGLLNSFLAARRRGYERKWIKDHDLEAISMPIFEGAKSELITHYEGGLYIGYRFAKVYYFPPEYVLIITYQPMMANGLDTLHGFLLFKVSKSD